jgi:hypothetical protein
MLNVKAERFMPKVANSEIKLSTKKLQYLKKPRIPRLETILINSHRFLRRVTFGVSSGSFIFPSCLPTKIYQRTDRNERQKAPIPPTVEHITCRKQENISQPYFSVERSPIEGEHKRKKNRESKRIEKHILSVFSAINS